MTLRAQTSTFAPTSGDYEPLRSMLQSFAAIDLHQLNARAAMLDRRDNKYILSPEVLAQALPRLTEAFDVLEINQQREFSYDTCYFDDERLSNFFDHLKNRRRRNKVRVRRYLESDLCFVEIKLKDRRGMTQKKRLSYSSEVFASQGLNKKACEFLQSVHLDYYGPAAPLNLKPTLTNSYRRITLVGKQHVERLTIDFDLRFSAFHTQQFGTQIVQLPPRFIIETKSSNANGLADRYLRELHQHPVNACSKYCVGLSLTGQVPRFNRFLPALRRLGRMP